MSFSKTVLTLDLADQLVASVGADRGLVAEIRFAVLLGSGDFGVPLPALGRLPVDRYRPLFQQLPFFLGEMLSRREN